MMLIIFCDTNIIEMWTFNEQIWKHNQSQNNLWSRGKWTCYNLVLILPSYIIKEVDTFTPPDIISHVSPGGNPLRQPIFTYLVLSYVRDQGRKPMIDLRAIYI